MLVSVFNTCTVSLFIVIDNSYVYVNLPVANSLVALIMQAQSSPASIRLSGRPCSHRRKKQRERDDDDIDPKQATEEHLCVMHRALSDSFLTVQATYEAKKGTFEITLDADSKDSDGGGEDGSQAVVCTATVEFENDLDDVAKITVECEDEKLAVNVRECLQNIAIGKYCFCWCWPGHQLRKTDLSFVFSVN